MKNYVKITEEKVEIKGSKEKILSLLTTALEYLKDEGAINDEDLKHMFKLASFSKEERIQKTFEYLREVLTEQLKNKKGE